MTLFSKTELCHTRSQNLEYICIQRTIQREKEITGILQMLSSNVPTLNISNVERSHGARNRTHNHHRQGHRHEKSKATCAVQSSSPYYRRTSSGSDGVDSTPPYQVPQRSSQLSSLSYQQLENILNLPTSVPHKPARQITTGGNSDDERAMPGHSTLLEDDDSSNFLPPWQSILQPTVQSIPQPTAQDIVIPTAQIITLPTAEGILLQSSRSIALPTAEGIPLPTAHLEQYPTAWTHSDDDVNNSSEQFSTYQHSAAAPCGTHNVVFCDGPLCRGATQGIVGHRFTCASCPSPVDLCEACYTSQTAHDSFHAFKRFNQADVTTYTICPPQKTRPEHHLNVFCDGPMCHGATQCIVGPRYVCANCPPTVDLCEVCYASQTAHNKTHAFKRFDKAGVKAHTMCPPQQQEQQQLQATPGQHLSVFCDGPMCRGVTQGIVGHRYTCAECPSSVDLCEACYTSQTAHDSFHAFKRFNQADVTTYTMCPPQKTRPEHHLNVFCDGPMCRGATQCIVGPRYMCANCPPTVDLCEVCYASQTAHNNTHADMCTHHRITVLCFSFFIDIRVHNIYHMHQLRTCLFVA